MDAICDEGKSVRRVRRTSRPGERGKTVAAVAKDLRSCATIDMIHAQASSRRSLATVRRGKALSVSPVSASRLFRDMFLTARSSTTIVSKRRVSMSLASWSIACRWSATRR